MSNTSPVIKLYKGFAGQKVIYIFGHVLKSEVKQREKLTSNPFKNALEMYRRYQVYPLKKAEVVLTLGEEHRKTKTDKRGFFLFKVTQQPEQSISFEVALESDHTVTCTGAVEKLAPSQIVVSDIDDTVLISRATNTWKKLYLLLTKNHESRKAFDGIRSFYHKIAKEESTSFFYVSSSEWNLYDFLRDFVKFNNLPDGIFLLQDIKSGIWDVFKSGGGSHRHKKEKIQLIMESFPEADYTLVGDSGQKDPYLYQEIALENPDRIRSIYIRDVRSSKRDQVLSIVDQLAESGIKMELFSNEKRK